MIIYNHSLIDQIDSRFFDTAKDAIQYALSAYWVNPIHCTTEEQEFAFDMQLKAIDFAQSGKIHFARR